MAKFFLVYPNPFIHMDHDGYPAGVCHCDLLEHVGNVRKWVGARLDQDQTTPLEKLSKEETGYRFARQQTRFSFDFSEPTRVPVTEYYRDRLRGGEILPADAATHKLAGLEGDFVPARQALAKAKEEALKLWRANYGPDERPALIDALDVNVAALQAIQTPAPVATFEPAPADAVKSGRAKA